MNWKPTNPGEVILHTSLLAVGMVKLMGTRNTASVHSLPVSFCHIGDVDASKTEWSRDGLFILSGP